MLAALLLLAALGDADLKFLKDVAETRYFRLGNPSSIQLTADGTTALFLRSPPRSPEMRLYAFDVSGGAVRERMRVTVRGFTAFEPSRDGKEVLVRLSGRAFLVPIAGGAAREVAGPD